VQKSEMLRKDLDALAQAQAEDESVTVRLTFGVGPPVRRSSSTLEIPSNGAHHFESSRDNVFVDAERRATAPDGRPEWGNVAVAVLQAPTFVQKSEMLARVGAHHAGRAGRARGVPRAAD
jgi:hypothetical protein